MINNKDINIINRKSVQTLSIKGSLFLNVLNLIKKNIQKILNIIMNVINKSGFSYINTKFDIIIAYLIK